MTKGLVTDKEQVVHKPKNFVYNVQYFNKRKTQLDNVFNQIKPDLQELSDYFAPRMSRFLVNDVNKPIKKSKKILNSVTLTAIKNFASGMQSGATSSATRWFKIQMKKHELNLIPEVKQWCADQEELTRRILVSSNFYECMLSVYKSIGGMLFGAISIEPDYNSVVRFHFLPVGSYRYAKDDNGVIDTFCRTYKDSAVNIVNKYGYENCSDSIKADYDDNRDSLFELVYFVEKNKDYNPSSPLAKHKKYKSVVYQLGQDKFLQDSGTDIFPFVVFESEVNGEDNYPSNCPAVEALPDAKQLMMQTKEYSKALKKITSPLYRGPASMQKQKGITDAPGQIVYDNENGQGLQSVYNVPPQVLEIKQHNKELEQAIKEHFYNDLFAVILNTAERGRTATEVNEIKEEKMVLLSPILDQVHKGLKQVHELIIYYCIKSGIMPAPPKEIQNEEMETEFVSALALAQKVKGIASIERFTTFTTNLAQSIDPTLVYKINGDQIIDDYAEIANINPAHVVPTKDVNKKREEIAQQQAQQQQIQALQQGSEMIKNMGGIDSVGADLATRMGLS